MIIDPLATKAADELRDTWQGRVLAEAKGRTWAVAMIMIANEYPTAIEMLLKAVFKGFKDITYPHLRGYAMVSPGGRICCEKVIDREHSEMVALYKNKQELTDDFRNLADQARLSDVEREVLFSILARWVVVDRRYTHEGKKLH